MKRIYLSILAIIATVSLVGGATYAVFSNKATSGPNTFATGNADLKIAIDTDSDFKMLGAVTPSNQTATVAIMVLMANLQLTSARKVGILTGITNT